jgi:hypothetical protein
LCPFVYEDTECAEEVGEERAREFDICEDGVDASEDETGDASAFEVRGPKPLGNANPSAPISMLALRMKG